MYSIPVIPERKSYWLVRTQGGRYYNEYRTEGCIAINWDEISILDIVNLSRDELENKIKTCYPDKKRPSRAAGQLKTFVKGIKKGDTVVITSYASNNFSIGEVIDDDCYTKEVSPEALEENSKLCPYQKRKKVRWIKEVHKWDVEMPMFKLLQHAQNTISDADGYADVIESMLHDFYIRGEKAELTLRVTKDGKIPWDSFFSMGHEISELAKDFDNYSSDVQVNMDDIDIKVNINSPGTLRLRGPIMAITTIGIILVSLVGGGINVPLPEEMGGNVDIHMNGLITEVTEYLDHKEARENKEMMLNKYMDDLEVQTPEELSKLMKAVEAPAENQAEAPAENQAEAPAENQAEPPAENQVEAPAENQVEAPAENQTEPPAEKTEPPNHNDKRKQ